jgi:hypothetical protein
MKIDHKFSAPSDSQMPFVHPDRPASRFRPLKALYHFRELIKDKEDTSQVFHIFESLPRPGFRKDAKAFVESDSRPCSTIMLACGKCQRVVWPTPIATSWKKKGSAQPV